MNFEPFAHSGSMRQFLRFARSTGLPLDRILDDDLKAIVRDAETSDRVPARALVDILQLSALRARRPSLGVAFASWTNPRGFGPFSLLWDHCPTIEESMRISLQYLHLEHQALRMVMEDEGSEVAIRQLLVIPTRLGGTQFIEATLTLRLRIIRLLLGEEWSPLRLELDHPAPPSPRFLRSVFRCPVVFEADRNAILISREDLRRPAPNGNAQMLAYLERQLQDLNHEQSFDIVQRVEQRIATNLAGGRATLDLVAELLALSRRSVQRHLADRGLTFEEVVLRVRRRVAQEYFAAERKASLTELAYRLGYGEAASASRFLRAQFGLSSRQMAMQARLRSAASGGIGGQ